MNRPTILVIPPTKYSKFMKYDQYLHTPLEGITIIANTLMSEGYDVQIFDCRSIKAPVNWILANMPSKSLIMGITTFFDSLKFISKLTAVVKEYYSEAIIILGGPLATFSYATFLNHTSSDFVVIGEGETTLVALVNFILDKHSVSFPSGIAFKKNGGVVFTTGSGLYVKNLDNIPDLNWGLYPDLRKRKFSFTYSIGRGCTKKCSYCSRPFVSPRSKSPEKVKGELLYLKSYGMDSVLLNDVDFLHIKGLEDYCRVFKELEIKWGCFGRPEKLNMRLLKFIRDHGCVNIRLGVESFDQEVLDKNQRGISVIEMKKMIQMVMDSGIPKITCYFLLGLPGETELSLERTIVEIDTLKGIISRPFYLIPLPGTKVYRDAFKKGLIHNEYLYLMSLEKIRLEADDYIPINVSQVSMTKLRQAFKAIANIAASRERNLLCPITV